MKRYSLGFLPTLKSKLLLIAFVIMPLHVLMAQSYPVGITITVAPPYPVSVSYYAEHPEQVLVQISNFSREPISFRLVGSVVGLDNNVKVVAKERGASDVITLNGGESRMLNTFELQNIFDARKLVFTGINFRKTQIDDGLPEGLYQVCLFAVDAVQPTMQRSAQHCSNVFPVTNLEPPIIISPMADEVMAVKPVQNIIVTWTLPAMAPVNTEYTVRMVEVPTGMNPNQAILAATTPSFFETTVSVNTILYGPTEPPLEPGRRYAMMVTAKDPTNKAVFRNGGRSAVQVFTYGLPIVNQPIQMGSTNDLFFTSPSCNTGNTSAISKVVTSQKTTPTFKVDAETPLTLTWLWKMQFTKDGLMQDEKPLIYNNSVISYYQVTFKRTTKSTQAIEFVYFSKKITTSHQYVSLPYAEVKQYGMLDGSTYVAEITAFDSGNKSLITTTSCPFTVGNFVPDQKQIFVKGRLQYKFIQNGDGIKPANHTSFQIAYAPLNSIGTPKQAYFTTDANGYFSGGVDRAQGPHVITYNITSPYYKSTLVADTVDFGNYSKDSVTQIVSGAGTKDTLQLGERITTVMSYDLTVRVGKGFPKFTYDPKFKALIAGNTDTLTVAPNAKIKDGTPVRLYRRRKNMIIPFFEAGTKITAFSDNQEVLVAEAKTTTDPNAYGKGKSGSVVKFKNLVINFSEDDEYYLKAVIGKPAVQSSYTAMGANAGNPFLNPGKSAAPSALLSPTNSSTLASPVTDTENLTAPEMRIQFDKNILSSANKDQYHYQKTVDYNLISMSPPISRIKGRIVYAWPSEPNVIRPLRNTKVVVKLRYAYNGGPYPYDETECATTSYALYKPGAQPKGKTKNAPDSLALPDEGFVVGVAETDGNGNFEFNIINHNQKGLIYKNAVLVSNTIPNPDCMDKPDDEKAQKPKTPGSSIQDKIDAVYDPYEMTSMNVMKGFDVMKTDVMQGGKTLNFSDGYNTTSQWSQMKTDLPATQGMDFGAQNLNTTKSIDVQFGPMQGNLSRPRQQSPNAIPNALTGKPFREELQQPSASRRNFVIGNNGEESLHHNIPAAPTVDVDRMFEIKAANDYIGGNFLGGGDLFVINAFESKDFGTIQMKVNEITEKKIHLIALDDKKTQDKTVSLTNARLLVYRPEKPTTMMTKIIPEGEGSHVHPFKALNPTTFAVDQSAPSVEWILDHTLPIDAEGNFDLANVKLLKNYPYRVQVSADPAKTGVLFNAVTGLVADEEIAVQLGNSRISGRLYTKESGVGINGAVKVVRINSSGQPTISTTIPTDNDGYFEFYNGYPITWENNQQFQLTGIATGYKDVAGQTITALARGMNYFQTLTLSPAAQITGVVKGESLNGPAAPLACYIEREDGFIHENQSNGSFNVSAPDVPSQKLHLIPKDPAYFDSTIVVKNPGSIHLMNYGTIVLARRRHRIQLNLTFLRSDGVPFEMKNIFNLKERFVVSVNGEVAKTAMANDKGIVQVAFENVSVNNYTISILDKLQDFIPISFQLVNKESKKWQQYPVVLRQGMIVKGIVTLDGQPAAHAKVYADIAGAANATSTTAYTALQTFTFPNGQYVLRGLPTDIQKLKLIAVLDTTFLVNGASQIVDLTQIPKSVDFNLKKINAPAITDVYGFPFDVESVAEMSKGKYKVTGLINLSQTNNDLELVDPNTKVRVTDVPVDFSNGQANVSSSEIELKASAGLKMRLMKRYNVSMSNSNSTLQSLRITKGNNGGFIRAYASVVDNSFNYPSTYLNFGNNTNNFFFLGQLENEKVNPYSKIFTTEKNQNTLLKPLPKYQLTNGTGGALNFKFIGFNAYANPKRSYIERKNGRFVIDLNIADRINGDPRLDSVNIHIPDLAIDDQNVYPATGSSPITMKLQEWTLQVNNWTMDAKLGGLVSNNSIVKTGVVDVPATKFNLRHDLFVLDEFNVSGLSLGGGLVKLSEVNKEGFLVFDEKCGSDLKGHWRLAITAGTTGYAAKIKGLQPFTSNELKVDFIQLISYNKGQDNLFSLGQNEAIANAFQNKYLSFTPQFIASGANSFDLIGTMTSSVPRVPALGVSVNFTGSPGKLAAKSGAWKGLTFEAPGYVQYTAEDQPPSIDEKGIMTLKGQVVEPGQFNPIPCVFKFGNTQSPRMFLAGSSVYATATPDKKVFRLSLTADGESKSNNDVGLILNASPEKNGMWVEGNDWNNLRFSGTIDDKKNSGLISASPTLDFVVYGELQANSTEVKLDDIKTPLGSMKMVYNFGKKELVGTMTMQGVQMGSYRVDADVETRIGAPGFVLSGAASVNTGQLLVEGFGTIKMGLVVGNYNLDAPIIDRATQFSLDKNARCWLDANKMFKGVYVTGGYNIIDVQKGFDAILVAAYAHAVLGAEATFGLNKYGAVQASDVATIGVGAYGNVQAGMKAITGTSIEGSTSARMALLGNYYFSNGNFDIGADAGLSFKATVKQYAFVGTIEKSVSINAGAKIKYVKSGNNKDVDFDFHLGSGDEIPACPPAIK